MTVKPLFVTSDDVMEMMQVKRNKAYEIIREINKELKEKGHRTVQGRCPRNYFMKAYGLDEVETDDGSHKP